MSTIKVDTVRPVTTDASLTLQGDSSGSGITGITIDSSGNATLNGTANDLGTVTAGTLGSGVTFPAGGTGNPISVAIICDQKASVSSSGSFTAGAWRTRDLNTEISDPDGIVSIASNQFTLASGTYLIEWSCPALDVGRNQSKLYSITDTTDLTGGTSENADTATSVTTRSNGAYIHSITSSHTYEIRHYSESSRATNGFGIDGRTGINSIYTIVKISKLK